ncbi:MAG: hypothetical protein HY735_23295, partial [Verrucomicrobia bacterium]|nr:hypothetical protein [Verrucomicrobiota bacterium]
AVDSAGNVYVADTYNYTIRKGVPLADSAPPPKPNIVVKGMPTVRPDPVTAGNSVTVVYAIMNLGLGDAGGSQTKIQIKNSSKTEVTAPTFPAPAIKAGESVNQSSVVPLSSAIPGGIYTAYVILDNLKQLNQSDTPNDLTPGVTFTVNGSFDTLFRNSGPGNVSPPVRSSYSSLPPKEQDKDSLIVVTHGWQPKGVAASQVVGPGFSFLDEQSKLIDQLVKVEWVDDMVKDIDQSLVTKGLNNWQLFAYKWKEGASTPFPDDALRNAANEGGKLGKDIVNQGWSHVHLIAHSAGAGLIQAAAEVIKSSGVPTVVHTTFLDAYVGLDEAWRSRYGKGSDWSDSYFSDDISDRLLEAQLTGGAFPWSHNVNVTWLAPDTDKKVTKVYCAGSDLAGSGGLQITGQFPCGVRASSSHPWPHNFYQATIPPSSLNDSQAYGFPLSKEGGGWNNRGNYPKENQPVILGGTQSVGQTVLPVRTDAKLTISLLPNAKSETGMIQLFDDHFNLFTGAAIGLQSLGKSAVGAPVWLSLGMTVTNVISFVTFDAQFTSAASAAGMLSVYWNTNRLGSVDEASLLPGRHSYTLALPGTFSNGDYVLGFRLDTFTNITSSVSVTNVAFGYVGLTNPITLNITRAVTNSSPILTLTSARGYNYLVQASTNLVDWSHLAILVNTNSTVQFIDSAATSESRRYYRAVLP